MGEYARDHILRSYGVDIGDDADRQYRPRRTPCPECGKLFRSDQGVIDHRRVKHVKDEAAAAARKA